MSDSTSTAIGYYFQPWETPAIDAEEEGRLLQEANRTGKVWARMVTDWANDQIVLEYDRLQAKLLLDVQIKPAAVDHIKRRFTETRGISRRQIALEFRVELRSVKRVIPSKSKLRSRAPEGPNQPHHADALAQEAACEETVREKHAREYEETKAENERIGKENERRAAKERRLKEDAEDRAWQEKHDAKTAIRAEMALNAQEQHKAHDRGDHDVCHHLQAECKTLLNHLKKLELNI